MADPVSASIIGVGAVSGIAGKYIENQANADREESEAAWYKEQAGFYQKEGEETYAQRSRALAQVRGQQIANFGARGGAFGATESSLIAETDSIIDSELSNIQENTRFKIREALLKGKNQSEAAGLHRSFGFNLLGALNIAGNSAGSFASAARGAPTAAKAAPTVPDRAAQRSLMSGNKGILS